MYVPSSILNELEFQYENSQNVSTQNACRQCHKRRVELADPYFLPYSRLRPRCKIEIEFHIMTLPFTVREGDLIV